MSTGQQVRHMVMPPSSQRSPTASVPRTPGSSGSPRYPDSGRPRTPDSGSPRYPDSGSPQTPDSGSPRYPGSGSPRTPDSGSPWYPGSGRPRTPDSGSPRYPGSGRPRTPDSGSPRYPGSPQYPGSPRPPGTPGSERVASPLECSICFSGYDNIFKTPKELSCTHVFCLECLARLAAAQPPGRPGGGSVPCPFCRQPTVVPAAGAPALCTSRQLQAKLPAHLRREEPVWLEGTRLCCCPPAAPGLTAPGFVCVDVGLSKPAEPPAPVPSPAPARRPGRLARCWARCGDWRRLALITALLLLLFCVVLWPVQCALKTGNLRCLPRPTHSTTTATTQAAFSLGTSAHS